MAPLSERFEMRLDEDLVKRLDKWRAERSELPSRSEAARALIEIGLIRAETSNAEVTDGEKLILGMLTDMYKSLKIKGESDPDLIMSSIYGGHMWALKWELTGLLHDHVDDRRKVSEVVNILDMWSFMESAYEKSDVTAKTRIKTECTPLGDPVRFHGFDGNNESEHMGIARFLIDKLDRFQSFKGRDMNSHCPVLQRYLAMYRKFEGMRPSLGGGRELSTTQLIDLMNTR
ncbi:MAG: YfbU family protein [Phycisphaerales bacterium]|nr:YfbU family protein [Hyphomonadaceae bacterium]